MMMMLGLRADGEAHFGFGSLLLLSSELVSCGVRAAVSLVWALS